MNEIKSLNEMVSHLENLGVNKRIAVLLPKMTTPLGHLLLPRMLALQRLF